MDDDMITKKPPDPSNSNSPSAAVTRAACAVCKYQRRKCKPDCILSPYFPAEKQTEFLNAHKLFGVNKLAKVLRTVKPHERENAMISVIYEAEARAADKVGGCYRIVQELQARMRFLDKELELVRRILAMYRSGFGSASHESQIQTQLGLNNLEMQDSVVDQSSSSKGKKVVHGIGGHYSNSNSSITASADSLQGEELVRIEKHMRYNEQEVLVEHFLNDKPT